MKTLTFKQKIKVLDLMIRSLLRTPHHGICTTFRQIFRDTFREPAEYAYVIDTVDKYFPELAYALVTVSDDESLREQWKVIPRAYLHYNNHGVYMWEDSDGLIRVEFLTNVKLMMIDHELHKVQG